MNKKGTPHGPEILDKARAKSIRTHINRTAEKAEILFILYEQMGAERSVQKLADLCKQAGINAGDNTIARYSIRYHWQQRLMEKQVQLKQKIEAEGMAVINKMNEQHIQANQGLLAVAMAGLRHYMEEMQRKKKVGLPPSLKLKPIDIVTMIRQAQVGERLARNLATDRSEVVVEVVNTFLEEFAVIFLAVNDLDDAEERKREYARRCEEMIKIYAAKKNMLSSGD